MEAALTYIYDWLKASAAITALVPAGRIYAAQAPASTVGEFITFNLEREAIATKNGLIEYRLTISAYMDKAKTAAQIIDIIEGDLPAGGGGTTRIQKASVSYMADNISARAILILTFKF